MAIVGFAAGLVAAMLRRWMILNVDFRHGNFARAVWEFAKTMFWWGVVGGIIGLGVGMVAGWIWQRVHAQRRRQREVAALAGPARPIKANAAPGERAPAREPGALAPAVATERGGVTGAAIADGAVAAATSVTAASAIRYDDAPLHAEEFVALAGRVWPHRYDAARAALVVPRTVNISAWDGHRLVGVVRVLTDGYLYAMVPEILVDPAYRGRGIGRELMNRAFALAPGGRLAVGATSDSVGFFQRLGCELAPMGFVMRRPAVAPETITA